MRDSAVSNIGDSCSSLRSWMTTDYQLNRPNSGSHERRRRRLPEIPRKKACKFMRRKENHEYSMFYKEFNKFGSVSLKWDNIFFIKR